MLITEVKELIGKTVTDAERQGPDVALTVAKGGKRWSVLFRAEADLEHDSRVTMLTQELGLVQLYSLGLATREEVREKLTYLVEHESWEEVAKLAREMSLLKEVVL